MEKCSVCGCTHRVLSYPVIDGQEDWENGICGPCELKKNRADGETDRLHAIAEVAEWLVECEGIYEDCYDLEIRPMIEIEASFWQAVKDLKALIDEDE